VPVIRAARSLAPPGRLTVVDGPPGTSCAAVAAVRNTDAVLLVTEQTPFGLHDLGLAVETLRKLGLPMAVVVNRAGTGYVGVRGLCLREGIPVLAEIPEDRRIAEAASRGVPLLEALPGTRELLVEILGRMEEIAEA